MGNSPHFKEKKLMGIIATFILLSGLSFAEPFVVGFAQDTLANDWRKAQVDEALKTAANYENMEIIVKDAGAKPTVQLLHVDEFITMGVDGIITSPFDTPLMGKALAKAQEKGIKVVLLSRKISADSYDVFIAPDNFNIAKRAGEFLLEQMNYKGTVLMLQGVDGVTTTKAREDGFEAVASQYPKVKIIKRRGNFLRSDTIAIMEELYKNGVKFDAIYSHSDSMLIGAREVMRHLGKDTSIPMVGIDYVKAAREAIINGEQSASFTYPTVAKEGVEAMMKLLNGEELPRKIEVESIKITPQNAQDIAPIF
jgi:ribose transport system substrate-binding protein